MFLTRLTLKKVEAKESITGKVLNKIKSLFGYNKLKNEENLEKKEESEKKTENNCSSSNPHVNGYKTEGGLVIDDEIKKRNKTTER